MRLSLLFIEKGKDAPADRAAPRSARSWARSGRRPCALGSPPRGAGVYGAAPRDPSGSPLCENLDTRYGGGARAPPFSGVAKWQSTRLLTETSEVRLLPPEPSCRCSSKVEQTAVNRPMVVRFHPPTPRRPYSSKVEFLPRNQEIPVRFRMGAPDFAAWPVLLAVRNPVFQTGAGGFDSLTGHQVFKGREQVR